MKTNLLIVCCSLIMFTGFSQNRGFKCIEITINEKPTPLYTQSHALLIGISDYENGWSDLPGVRKDIQEVKSTLEKHHFNVIVVENASSEEIKIAFDEFISKYSREYNARLLVFYSGHGYTLQQSWGGEMGYLVPADAPNPHLDAESFKDKAIDMEMMEVYAKRMDSKHALFLFDCCFSGSIFSLSKAAPAIISYKTKKPVRQFITAGSAEEEVPDESIFCQQFISGIEGEADMNKDGYISGSELGEFLQTSVVNYSYDAQHPQYGKIRNPKLDKGDFVFVIRNQIHEKNITTTLKPVDVVKNNPQTSSLQKKHQTPLKSYEGMTLVEGGTFMMGNNNGNPDEKPAHKVILNDFYMDMHETTVADFKNFVDATGYITDVEKRGFTWLSGTKRKKVKNASWRCNVKGKIRPLSESNHPAIFLSKKDATAYCKWKGGRLATEAEWEYAARGGTKSKNYVYSGSNNYDEVAWHSDNSSQTTHPVGQKKPNELGLYDMSGNVFEYCIDSYEKTSYQYTGQKNPIVTGDDDYKVARGGSWYNHHKFLRTTNRSGWRIFGNTTTGIRCVRDR